MTTTQQTEDDGFSAEERAAIKDRAAELKSPARRGKASREDGEREVRTRIDALTGSDRASAEAFHALVAETAPELVPQTYYGFPAYAKDGKVLFWLKPAAKFRTRYAQVEFSDKAALDDGAFWATSFALPDWTPEAEERLRELVRRAAR
ncbi:hypothetical protein QDR37_06040 [Amnibacterium sp. CER49]|uniref:hypothetical protein n=1 Tax=Amnibacterium sp. CER49 TaxID=3039161 RepID=UPI002449180B|nr:hypothetical protein [Amnibacterium sp. CER49]MDH2443500.1 hypothetical protein [Amnibacterium sp. CER49]